MSSNQNYNPEELASTGYINTDTSSANPVKFTDTSAPTVPAGYSELFDIKSVQYPLDIDSADADGFQRHFVRFSINLDEESRLIKRDKVKATDVDNSAQNRFRTGNTSETRALAGVAAAGAATAIGSSFGGKLIGKLSSKTGKLLAAGAIATVAGGISAATVSSSFNVTKKLKKLATTITLYTPGNVSAHYGINYSETTDMTNDLLNTDRGSELIKDSKTGELTPLSAATKLTRILATSTSEIVQNLTRTARNPKKDMLFHEVAQRQFQFDYVFMPKNAEEAYEVANIIYMFKYFAHPEMLEGYDQFLLIYPAEFDIEYVYKTAGKEERNIWINKISSCVLESIDINYGPNGTFQTLVSGEPVITTMTLRFKEIESLTSDRIAKGY